MIKFSKQLMILVVGLILAACGGESQQNNAQSSPTVTVNISTNASKSVNKQKGNINGVPDNVTNIIISVLDGTNELSKGDILAAGGTLTFTVPEELALTLTGKAFVGDTLTHAGQFTISPLRLGQNTTVNFSLNEIQASAPGLSTPIPIQTVATASQSFAVPEDKIEINTPINNGFDGALLFAGTQPTAGANGVVFSDRFLTGFVVEQSALQPNIDAQAFLIELQKILTGSTELTLANIAISVGTGGGSATGEYILTLATSTEPTQLSNNLVNLLAVSVDNPVIDNLPQPLGNEVSTTDYRLFITVSAIPGSNQFIVICLTVPNASIDEFNGTISVVNSSTNIQPAGSNTVARLDSFTAPSPASNNVADFLFVVDNSGSMSDEQAAVSAAGANFQSVVKSSNVDFQVGVITTDNSTLRGTGFTSDLTQFEQDVQPGISGSGTERGIFFSEQALQSIALGDAVDGSVTASGYPRAGASLSVVIISDEPSQYAGSIDCTAFDVNNNLFIDRGYRVYAIVNDGTGREDGCQYDDLALATGGSFASIKNLDAIPVIMESIAAGSSGTASPFQLGFNPISSSINVQIDNVLIENNAVNGWIYFAQDNSIVFRGTAKPQPGNSVAVSYITLAQ